MSGGELSIISFGADLRYSLGGGSSSVVPYLVARASGLKLSDVEVSETGPGGVVSSLNFVPSFL